MSTSIAESRRFLDEVTSGDSRRALTAVVERLAVELDQAEGARNVAVLCKVLLDVFRALDGLPAPRSDRSLVDELNDRRDERLTARGEVPAQRFGGREPEKYPRRRSSPKKSS